MAPPHRIALLVLAERRDDGTISSGTMDEIRLANELGIPVVYYHADSEEPLWEVLALRGTER